MFIRVVLPAPFSPSRARISPGSTVRSIWSLATRLPNRLVMPVSSSFTRSLLLPHSGHGLDPTPPLASACPGAARVGPVRPHPDRANLLRRARRGRLDRPVLDIGLDL